MHYNNSTFKFMCLINTILSSNLLVQGVAKGKEEEKAMKGIGGEGWLSPGLRAGMEEVKW